MKFFSKRLRYEHDHVNIGKKGYLFFNRTHIEVFGINKKQKYKIGYGDERPLKVFYLIECDNSDKKGYSLTSLNKDGCVIRLTKFLNVMNIEKPLECKIEKYSYKEFKGFKLIIEKP